MLNIVDISCTTFTGSGRSNRVHSIEMNYLTHMLRCRGSNHTVLGMNKWIREGWPKKSWDVYSSWWTHYFHIYPDRMWLCFFIYIILHIVSFIQKC